MGYKMNVGADDVLLQAVFTDLGTNVITSYGWATSNAGAATITPVGDGITATLHAVGAGSTDITLTATRYSGAALTNTFNVVVTAAGVPAVHILNVQPPSQAYPNDPAGPGGGGQIPGGGNTPQ